MSSLIANSFQVPNAFVDRLMMQLSGNATKCYLLVVRKTVGWGKESDRISISQFQKYTGVNDKKTIYKVVKELEDFGLILSKKERGLITEFSLNFDHLDQYQKTAPVPKNTSTKKRVQSSTKKRHPTKPNIQNPIKESKPKKRFQKPTADKIKDYLKETNNDNAIDADYFIDYYEAKDWMIGNNRMKDWKAAVRNWLRRETKSSDKKQSTPNIKTEIMHRISLGYNADYQWRSSEAEQRFNKMRQLPGGVPWNGNEWQINNAIQEAV